MNILALDTCTELCSAALKIDDQLVEKSELTQRGHSEKILAMFDQLFEQTGTRLTQVNVVAFGRGPGSFTGVRIGVGVVQGVAFARQLPVAPVSSLAAVAQQAIDNHQAQWIAVALDARMGEVYAAHFKNEGGLAVLLDEEKVCAPELFLPLNQQQSWFAAGSGWAEYEDVLKQNFADRLAACQPTLYPHAASIIKLAEAMIDQNALVAADQAMPVYLRDNVAKKKGEQS